MQRDIHLLTGLIFDESGERLSPIHATKAGERYRYYVSDARPTPSRRSTVDGRQKRRVAIEPGTAASGLRLPAAEIEAVVLGGLRRLMGDHPLLAGWIEAAGRGERTEAALRNAGAQADRLDARPAPDGLRDELRIVLRRVEVAGSWVRLAIDRTAVVAMLTGRSMSAGRTGSHASATERAMKMEMANASVATAGNDRSAGGDEADPVDGTDLHVIDIPVKSRRRGIARRLVIEGESGMSPPRPDRPLIDMIARAHAYREALCDGRGHGRREIAERFGTHPEEVSRLLPLAFLAPPIVEAILTGRQPADLSVRTLTRRIDLPVGWTAQAKLLGF